MASINRIVLTGRVTRDPEVRETKSGLPVANGGIAVEHYTKSEEDVVSFVDWVVFGNFATLLGAKLRKGDSVTIEGRIQQRKWEAEDGTPRSKLEVVADNVVGEFSYRKADGSDTPALTQATPEAPAPVAAEGDDSIPF